jgi:hypothetical protein
MRWQLLLAAVGLAACPLLGCTATSQSTGGAAAPANGISSATGGTASDVASTPTGASGAVSGSRAGVGGNTGSGGTGGSTGAAAGGTGGNPADAGSAALGAGSDGGAATPTGNVAPAPKLPPVTSVDADGPFKTTQDLAAGPNGQSGLFYPTELGKDGLQHPIFLFGCGGSSTPSQYVDHMNRIASHGFVTIAEISTTAADGATLKASLDWIIAQNERPQSVFFHKLDTTKIAVGGHSIGSVNAFAIASDPRLTTSIHVAGGSLGNQGSSALTLTHPAAYICSESDVFGNVEKAQADYKVTTVPVFFTVMTGSDHVAAARDGLPAIVAWLRWHLGGETDRRSSFLDSTGEFRTGKFVSQSKNW